MKGIILIDYGCSSYDQSLNSLPYCTNTVYDKPAILHTLENLRRKDLSSFIIIGKQRSIEVVMNLNTEIQSLGIEASYKINETNSFLEICKSFQTEVQDQNFVLLFGDTIVLEPLKEVIKETEPQASIFVAPATKEDQGPSLEIGKHNLLISIFGGETIEGSHVFRGLSIWDKSFTTHLEVLGQKNSSAEFIDLLDLYERKGLLTTSEEESVRPLGTPQALVNAQQIVQIKKEGSSKVINQSKKEAKVVIGMCLFNPGPYLKPCLQSLLSQEYNQFKITILDNGSTDGSLEFLECEHPEIEVIKSQENLGFGAAHNKIINNEDMDYYACLTVDVIYEPTYLAGLVQAMIAEPQLGSVGGKLKRWDFANFLSDDPNQGKTNFIDTVGLKVSSAHRFIDLGQGEVDHGQYDGNDEVFGISGAAVLYRKKALDDVAYINGSIEYFDSSMFMYKEDVDLAYRLQWAGWKSRTITQSVSYHDRTAAYRENEDSLISWIKNRRKKTARINRISYLNHQILLYKNFSKQYSSKIRISTAFYNLKIFLYLLFCETETLFTWYKFWKNRSRHKDRRKKMHRRVDSLEIERFMKA